MDLCQWPASRFDRLQKTVNYYTESWSWSVVGKKISDSLCSIWRGYDCSSKTPCTYYPNPSWKTHCLSIRIARPSSSGYWCVWLMSIIFLLLENICNTQQKRKDHLKLCYICLNRSCNVVNFYQIFLDIYGVITR